MDDVREATTLDGTTAGAKAAVQAYAGRRGVDFDAFVQSMAPVPLADCAASTLMRSLRPAPQH